MSARDWSQRLDPASSQRLEQRVSDASMDSLIVIFGSLGFALVGRVLYVRLLAPGKNRITPTERIRHGEEEARAHIRDEQDVRHTQGGRGVTAEVDLPARRGGGRTGPRPQPAIVASR